ncbi:hypothetical protein B7H19_10040 [Pseudomonas putida]|uniref:hypothetical protein n=1 Tax=Pseudomonas putida TaxID=303 RepID=UPI000A11E284|nr:hypothetical protein [Pseudomonas putida]ORL69266.1 hypothetical protein B7H19_10040 [Pseudomonas putida]
MIKKTQILYDENQHPLVAMVPYEEYIRLLNPVQEPPAPVSLLSKDRLSIKLPYGGNEAHIDLPRFVDYWARNGILSMPINQRAKSFSEFTKAEMYSVEALIRGKFLPKDSPYINTMQANGDVIKALVETGMFEEVRYDSAWLVNGTIFSHDQARVREDEVHKFSRTVKCLRILAEPVAEYMKQHPVPPSARINDPWFK